MQQSLFQDPMKVRRRGPTFVLGEGSSGGGPIMTAGSTSAPKLKLLTATDVLKKCLLYRIGAWSEFKLIGWIERLLVNERYSIESNLRMVLVGGLAELKSTKNKINGFDTKRFLEAIERLESRLELIKSVSMLSVCPQR